MMVVIDHQDAKDISKVINFELFGGIWGLILPHALCTVKNKFMCFPMMSGDGWSDEMVLSFAGSQLFCLVDNGFVICTSRSGPSDLKY